MNESFISRFGNPTFFHILEVFFPSLQYCSHSKALCIYIYIGISTSLDANSF